ncbi:MAG: hypothetical protein Q9210_003396 [Variospora velana]
MSSDQDARTPRESLTETQRHSALTSSPRNKAGTPIDLISGSLSSHNPTEKHSNESTELITKHTHTASDPSNKQNSTILVDLPTHHQSHSPHHLTTTPPAKTSSPVHQSLASATNSPPSPISSQPSPGADPRDWVDPLLLSPFTPSSQASSPTWGDPLRDWDGTLSESPEGWVDPLIADTLSSHSSSAPSSPGQRVLETRKRKRTASTSSRQKSRSGTPSVAQSNMAEDGHKGKNVPKTPKDASWIRGRLEVHGLLQNDRDAYKKYPQLAATVDKIISRKRHSEVDSKEFEDFQLTLETYKGQNEDTVLTALLPYIIKPDRTVQVSPARPAAGGSPGQQSTMQNQPVPLNQEEVWEVQSFLRSGLVTIVNREFARTFLAFREDGKVLDKEVVKALQKEAGMTNPKPDRIYAVVRTKYKFPPHFQLPADISVYLEIMKDVHHPFLIIEGKSDRGSPLEAANQACRGGAALVRTARLLRARLGEADVQGADLRTFVFSATLSPGLIELWVHWAEVPAPKEGEITVFHMTKLSSKALDDEHDFGQVRRMLHNILDWGCGARFDQLEPLYEAIMTCVQQEQQQQQAHSGAGGVEQKTEKSGKKAKTGP